IEDGRDVEVDVRRVPPGVRGRQHDVLGKRSRIVDAHALRVRALDAPPGHAVAATAAHEVALTAHEIARVQLPHVGPGFDDLANELMADDERHRYVRLSPAVPFIDVQVRTADTGSEYADQHIVPAWGGDWDILKPEAGLGSRLDQRFHSAPGRSPLPCYGRFRPGSPRRHANATLSLRGGGLAPTQQQHG